MSEVQAAIHELLDLGPSIDFQMVCWDISRSRYKLELSTMYTVNDIHLSPITTTEIPRLPRIPRDVWRLPRSYSPILCSSSSSNWVFQKEQSAWKGRPVPGQRKAPLSSPVMGKFTKEIYAITMQLQWPSTFTHNANASESSYELINIFIHFFWCSILSTLSCGPRQPADHCSPAFGIYSQTLPVALGHWETQTPSKRVKPCQCCGICTSTLQVVSDSTWWSPCG